MEQFDILEKGRTAVLRRESKGGKENGTEEEGGERGG
jgi:hypothetical protein